MALNLVSANLTLQNMISSGNATVSNLFNLVSQVDAQVQNASPGSTFLLYTGGPEASAISASLASTVRDVYDIGSTAAGEFVDSTAFRDALRDAVAQEQFNTDYGNASNSEQATINASVDQHIYGTDATGARVDNSSLFDIVSHSYVTENDGDWRVVAVGNVDPNSVAMQTELPALLSKPGDFSINGDSRSALSQAGSLAEQVNMAIAESAAISQASLVSPSSAGDFLSMTTQKALQVLASPESAALVQGAADALSKLGWAGMLLSAALAAQDANAAYASGDNTKGNELVGNWLGQFAAGWEGATVAAEIVGSALAPLYLAGPAGAVIAGGLTLLAGLGGGILGSVGAGALLSKAENGGLDSLINSLQGLFHSALTPVDPLVLDLDGSGIKTVGINSGAHFDYNGTGFAQQTAWVTPNEGILVLDKNGDGKITGDELIGNAGTDATTAATNGFTTLASLDSNGDGVIDAHDSAFSQLRVWVDANGDGISQAGELKTLDELGITSIHLAYTGESITDTNGNRHLAISSFTTKDGATHTMEDLWLNVDTARTVNTTQVAVSAAVSALPDVAGFGNVPSLHDAIALDTTGQLQSLVQSFIAATEPSVRAQIATSLIYAWAGVAQNDPNGRDNNIYGHVIDARKIETLEAFLGQHYAANYGQGADPNPRHTDAVILSAAFDELVSYVSGQLLAQSELKDLYADVHLSLNANGQAFLDVSALVTVLSSMYQKDPVATTKIIADLGTNLRSQGDSGQQIRTALQAQGDLGQTGFSRQLATLGANVVNADAGQLIVRGQEGVDNILIGIDKASLYASSGFDTLIAGSGDEILYGGTGTDTFVLEPGFDKDILIETSKSPGVNQDVVQISNGFSAAQTQIYRDLSNSLVLVFGEGSQLTVQGYFLNSSNQPVITFADGTRWDYTAIASNQVLKDTSVGGNTLFGLNGASNHIVGAAGDTIFAGNYNDTITAGRNNMLYTGAGVDTFVVNPGCGQVVLNESYMPKSSGTNQDVIQLGGGITASGTQVNRTMAGDLVMDFGNGDSLRISGYLGRTSNPVVKFADGTTWDYSAVTDHLVFIDTSAGGNTLSGLSGVNNQIVGAVGDMVIAGDRNDMITVGKNNIVYAGMGVDTVIVNAGTGQTSLHETTNKSAGRNQDVIQLGAGITASATQVARDLLNNLVLNFGNGDSLQVASYLSQTSVPVIRFADGTTWDYATVMNNLVFTDTTAGGNTLSGLSGVNNRIVGAAQDTIYAGDRNDTITVGKNNFVQAGSGADTFVVNAGSGQTTLSENTIKSAGRNQDVIQLGAGITVSGTQITRDVSNNLVLNFDNGDSLKVASYLGAASAPVITFADGTTWDYATVTNNLVFTDTTAGGNMLYGLNGMNNQIVGAAGDVIHAGDRNDTITAGKNNTVIAGNGIDTFIVNPGSGQVVLSEIYASKSGGKNQDVIRLGAGITASGTQITRDLSNNLVLNFGNGDSLKVAGYLGATSAPVITFADGTTWDYATVTNNLVFTDTTAGGNMLYGLNGMNNQIVGAEGDVIHAGDRNDTITAGKNNTVIAGNGIDTFIVNPGSGQVVLSEIYASKSGGKNQDVIRLGAGITASGTQITRDLSKNLVLNFGNGDSLQVAGYLGATSAPVITFADGTTWDYATVTNNLMFTDTTAGGNTLNGLSGMNNQIVGATGDTIIAGNLNDTITVGRNNTVYAESGIDTFIINAGTGQTTLTESTSKSGGKNQDVIRLGAGITASGTQITRDLSNNLVLNFGNGDVLKVASYLGAGSAPVITFADGTTWDYATVTNAMVFADTGAGGNTLRGLNGVNNQIVGATGDTIIAGNLNDTITVGRNNTVYAESGIDTFIINVGTGQTTLTESTSKSGGKNQDVIRLGAGITASGTQITRDLSNNLVLNFGNGDVLKVASYLGTASAPVITFADGTTWDYTTVTNAMVFADTGAGGNTLRGLNGVNNQIVGATGDTIIAGNLNDTITVGRNNTVYAESGIDTFIINAGTGQTTLTESTSKSGGKNQDVIRLGAGITASGTQITRDLSNNLVLNFGNGDVLKVASYLGTASAPVITFADGTTWDYATVTNAMVFADTGAGGNTLRGLNGVNNQIVGATGDTIIAGNLNDTITVGRNNTVYAESGIDTFIINVGTGQTTLTESTSKSGGKNQDVLKFGSGITSSSLVLSTQNGSDLLIDDGVTGDQIRLIGMLSSGGAGVQTFEFADGTTLTRSQLLSMSINVSGSAGVSQTLNGTSGNNVFNSHGGNDVEIGAGGNDTYILQPGYGGITINNGISTNAAASGDLQLEGVNPDNIWLKQIGNNLQVSVLGSTTEATIDNWFSNTYSQLSEVTVSGGSSGSLVLDSQMNQLIQAMATFSANNPGFDATSSANPAITDPTLLATVNSAWHH